MIKLLVILVFSLMLLIPAKSTEPEWFCAQTKISIGVNKDNKSIRIIDDNGNIIGNISGDMLKMKDVVIHVIILNKEN